MTGRVLVWDLETVRDIEAAARVLGLVGHPDEEVRAALGPDFPKLPLHKIACIGALAASSSDNGWTVDALTAPHLGQHTEQELIAGFIGEVAALQPRFVTYNGATFDLPVLRYRAMVHRIAAPELVNYFGRRSDDAVDLCEVLAAFDPRSKVRLDLLCKTLGFAGKPDGIDGSQVETYVAEGKIAEVAAYCETDVVNTYRIWLCYELFNGRLSPDGWEASERNLRSFILRELASKPHLNDLIAATVDGPVTPVDAGSLPCSETDNASAVDHPPQ
jgi:3'-5' exonuclease